jgi:ATP-dependent exoDNAse (exonuclease V) beta subunit
MNKHISYSALKDWKFCPYYHKVSHVDKLRPFKGNEYTAFGTAIHSTYEKSLLEEGKDLGYESIFQHEFLQELEDLNTSQVELRSNLVSQMYDQGKKLASLSYPALKNTFGDFEVVSSEEKLYVPLQIDGHENLYFKGFIDVVLKKDDRYIIIDWKTCSWGWDARKKADTMLTYQLTLYKNFYAEKHGIDPSKIDTYFALVKRTAKKNNIEIFKVSSGKKKIENALKLLNKAIYNIEKKNYVKNRMSCQSGYGCPLYKTDLCK